MENKKSLNFFFLIIAIILGSTIYKQFDFENLKFEHTGLGILYSIVFLFSICILIKDYIKRPQK